MSSSSSSSLFQQRNYLTNFRPNQTSVSSTEIFKNFSVFPQTAVVLSFKGSLQLSAKVNCIDKVQYWYHSFMFGRNLTPFRYHFVPRNRISAALTTTTPLSRPQEDTPGTPYCYTQSSAWTNCATTYPHHYKKPSYSKSILSCHKT